MKDLKEPMKIFFFFFDCACKGACVTVNATRGRSKESGM
jgi:hypothetical protein